MRKMLDKLQTHLLGCQITQYYQFLSIEFKESAPWELFRKMFKL